jgi:hypothetical protein
MFAVGTPKNIRRNLWDKAVASAVASAANKSASGEVLRGKHVVREIEIREMRRLKTFHPSID